MQYPSKKNQELIEENSLLKQRIHELEVSQSERKRVEEADREEERFHQMFLVHNAIMLLIDEKTGAILDANHASARFYGYSIEKLCQMTIQEINVLPAEEVAHQRALALEEKRNYFIFPHRLASGEIKTVEVHSSPVTIRNERILFSIIHDITDRKQVEEDLRESRELLDTTQQLAKIGGWEWIVSQQKMIWTDETYRIHGMMPGNPAAGSPEHIARSLACYDPNDRPIIEGAFQRCIEEGKSYDLEFPLTRTDGRRIWIRTMARPVIEGDLVVKVTGNILDITESRRAEEVLRHTEQHLRLANRATNDVIWDWDIINDLQQWNESGTIVFGWTEIVEHPVNADWWVQRVHPDDRQRIHDTFFGAVNNPLSDAWSDEYRFLKTDGSYADVLDRGYVLRDEQGKAVRMVGAMLDITERKRSLEALRERENAMRAIFDATTEALSVIDVEGNLLMINTTFANRFNKTSEDLIGTSIYDLIAPELAKTRREYVNLVLRSSKPIQFEDQRGDRFVEHSLYPIFDGVGNVNRIAIFARDITERKQADKELRESEERFRVLSEAAFEAIAIHEEGVLHNANEQIFQNVRV